jgi:hypothetical protein
VWLSERGGIGHLFAHFTTAYTSAAVDLEVTDLCFWLRARNAPVFLPRVKGMPDYDLESDCCSRGEAISDVGDVREGAQDEDESTKEFCEPDGSVNC